MSCSPWCRKVSDMTEQLNTHAHTILCLRGSMFLTYQLQMTVRPALSSVQRILRTRLPTQEVQVQSLGQEDPLEEKMATHSSVLARKIP